MAFVPTSLPLRTPRPSAIPFILTCSASPRNKSATIRARAFSTLSTAASLTALSLVPSVITPIFFSAHSTTLHSLNASLVATASAAHSLKARLASTLMSRLPPPLVVLLLSALPVIELRGAIPVSLFYLSLPAPVTLLLSVIGNLFPLPFFYLLLHLPPLRRFLSPFISRAQKKTAPILRARWRALALAIFVAVPLPGTGGWTGTIIAYLAGFSFLEAAASISIGVLTAGIVVLTACLMGWVRGGVVLLLAALLATVAQRSILSNNSIDGVANR